jgi:3',5'-cyclic AMP phosphodiesterase CpdA
MDRECNRRDALKAFGTLMLGTGLGVTADRRWHRRPCDVGAKGGSLRIAHLTDCHVQPGDWGRSRAGLTRCLRQLQALQEPPDLILNGGDAIMDGVTADPAGMRRQWDLWETVFRSECRLPVEHCLGNHDLVTATDEREAKAPAMDRLGLTERFRSFDRGGWHFIVLDSVRPVGKRHEARLDEPQFEWLTADLENVRPTTPVLVLSHIPILSACALLDGNNAQTGRWQVPCGDMHLDARRLIERFNDHGNVRLCLSGHIHLADRVEYNGVTYLCDGAVCGNWWDGAYQHCPPGWGLIDLHPDGSFTHQYLAYD